MGSIRLLDSEWWSGGTSASLIFIFIRKLVNVVFKNPASGPWRPDRGNLEAGKNFAECLKWRSSSCISNTQLAHFVFTTIVCCFSIFLYRFSVVVTWISGVLYTRRVRSKKTWFRISRNSFRFLGLVSYNMLHQGTPTFTKPWLLSFSLAQYWVYMHAGSGLRGSMHTTLNLSILENKLCIFSYKSFFWNF